MIKLHLSDGFEFLSHLLGWLFIDLDTSQTASQTIELKEQYNIKTQYPSADYLNYAWTFMPTISNYNNSN